MASAILSVHVKKCPHFEGIRCLRTIPNDLNIGQVLRLYHEYNGPKASTGRTFVVAGKKEEGKNQTALEETLLVSDVLHFNIKYLTFECRPDTEFEEFKAVVDETTRKTMNAFEVLMAKGRDYPKEKGRSSGKSEGLHRKDELYNELLKKYFRANSIDFPKALADSDGAYVVQVLCNALWYITNHHETINYAAIRHKDLLPLPTPFEDYRGYDDVKRKKSKALQLSVQYLRSHSEALYGILLRPNIRQKVCDDINMLADCMKAYKVYFEAKSKQQNIYHSLDHPVRPVNQFTTVENKKAISIVADRYQILNEAVRTAG